MSASVDRRFAEIQSLADDTYSADVRIHVGSDENAKTFHLHRCLLASASRYFHSMYHSGLKISDELNFPEWNPEDFEVFRRWIYFGDTSFISSDNFGGIWAIADYFLADGFKAECLLAFERTSNVQDVLEIICGLSQSITTPELQSKCFQTLVKYPVDDFMVFSLSGTPLNLEAVRLFVVALRWKMVEELAIFGFVMKWISAQQEEPSSELIEGALSSVALIALPATAEVCKDSRYVDEDMVTRIARKHMLVDSISIFRLGPQRAWVSSRRTTQEGKKSVELAKNGDFEALLMVPHLQVTQTDSSTVCMRLHFRAHVRQLRFKLDKWKQTFLLQIAFQKAENVGNISKLKLRTVRGIWSDVATNGIELDLSSFLSPQVAAACDVICMTACIVPCSLPEVRTD
eukprot:TRINITY_DN11779_c0_g1_i1.p2 TRINITY_DN11779_c0_g1~~TRINITY_DN11779_c0_g1_i1.p2  ORF type:complete len:402 (+),score=48.02 TRINITY_DN11779_c0_g1_i1:1466-2671(+)